MLNCHHCNEAAPTPLYDHASDPGKERAFCCLGCLTVHQVLASKGLQEYYTIKSQSGPLRRRAPVQQHQEHLEYLDGEQFVSQYVRKDSEGVKSLSFYLEGIHCLACLWLLERLPLVVSGVVQSRLDFDRSVLDVRLAPQGQFSAVASELSRLGYRPYPLKRSDAGEALKKKEERWQLLRLGVAGAGASNIMIYAVSIYGGAEGLYQQLFNALTVIFALPVMTFSAWPFYQSCWRALKSRQMSIDVPIALALLMGLGMGLVDLVRGVGENYFDSLTALVFLLLLSRYALRKLQERSLESRDMHFFHRNEAVQRVTDPRDTAGEFVHPSFLRADDLIVVPALSFFPADGIVLRGTSKVQRALLTGEFAAAETGPGNLVHAGTQNLEQGLVVKVTATEAQTELGQLLQAVERETSHHTPTLFLVQKVSSYFLWSVLALCVLLFLWKLRTQGFGHAFEAALTLLIVTCPCALAISIPLTFTRSLGLAARKGLIVKNAAALERLSKVTHVFLDKTGTLTQGRPTVLRVESALPEEQLAALVFALEERAQHPVGRALCEWALLRGPQRLALVDWSEQIGEGVRGTIGESCYQIRENKLWRDGLVLATFALDDAALADAAEGIAQLRQLGLGLKLISGDRVEAVGALAQQVGLSKEEWEAQLRPAEKAQRVSESPTALMVGDGANDALALARASVGVAVHGGMELALKASDIYFLAPGLAALTQLIHLSRETIRLVRRNLALSIAYNMISVGLVFAGLITPLSAAIVMPLSSLTVLASTLWGTKKLRSLWK